MKKEQTPNQYAEWLFETAKKNRNNPNHSEQAFIDILDYFDIPYVFQKPIIYDSKDGYIYDFYMIIDDKEYDIEIDGKSHMDELTKLKDFKRDVQAKEHNLKVIRLDSYFVLYLRNVFKDEFTKESFLEWIINGCPINLKKDMSEYKEKYEDTKKELDETVKWLKQFDETSKQFYKMIKSFNRQRAAEDIMKDILAKQKKYSTSTSSNNSSTVETSNEKEELPF